MRHRTEAHAHALLPVALLAALLVAGGGPLAEAIPFGLVAEPDHLAPGDAAPDFPIRGPDGEHLSFHRIRQDVTLLVFVDAENPLPPELKILVHRFARHGATVARVVPAAPGPRPQTQAGLASLYDPQGRVTRAYRQPVPGTVILVDRFDQVVAIGALGRPGGLVARACDLAREAVAREAEVTTGG